jgi:outer membrane lipoprotein SlyB
MKRIFFALFVLVLSSNTAPAQQHTRDGAALGGTAGAIIGGIIGHQNDETAEGAIIGGVVGAVAGGLAGNARDQQISREQYYQSQIYQQQQRMRQCVQVNDVVSMVNSGLSDTVIINHIQNNGIERRLEVHEIIQLHRQGVSEQVIAAMQNAPLAGAPRMPAYDYAPVIERRPTVIVREHYQVVPHCDHFYHPRFSYHYHHRHHW